MRFTKRAVVVSLCIVLLILLAIFATLFFLKTRPAPKVSINTTFKDASYIVEGKVVSLHNGVAEEEAAPGSASKITTKYFGNEAKGDLNGDGQEDVVFLLTQSGGGSGTFYYAVVALKTASGYQGTNAILLGDRIAPQTTEVHATDIVVNYADRGKSEPMSMNPSVGVSKHLKVIGAALVEVAP